MKRKTKILGVALSLVLMLSLMAFAAPVSAGVLSWSTVSIPSTTGKVLAPAGTDILDLTVAGDETTIYAASQIVRVATLGGGAAWSATQKHSGTTSALLSDGPQSVDFVLPTGITVEDFYADVTEFGFWHHTQDLTKNFAQFELRFEDPDTTGWLEITAVGLQNYTGTAVWVEETLSTSTPVGYGGNTPDGTSVFEWGLPGTLGSGGALSDINSTWASKETGKSVTDYLLTRVRVELWESDTRNCYIDDVTIDGTTYNLEGADGETADGEALSGILYKSTNSGATWSGLTNPSGAAAPQLVAVAPDDEDIVAIVADTNELYVTTNGGTTWGDLEFAGIDDGVINDIAISAEGAGIHYVVLAATDGTDAEVHRYNIGSASPSWKVISTAYPGFEAADTAVAVAFSPNFPSDLVMVVVTEVDDGSDAEIDYVKLQLWSENQDMWNVTAGFDSYPATIVSEDEITGLTAASITLDPDYLGSDDAMRLAFIGLTVEGVDADAKSLSGIHRMDNTTHKALKDGSAIKIHSIAYDGSTLVAGRYDNNICYYSTDPTATTPTVSGTRSLKRPGNSDCDKTVVAWAGADVVAGTSGDESAFAVSINNGKSFSDISLIDTALTNMTDVAVSPNGKVFMATDDGGDLSLWRYASSWERVLAIPNKAGFIVRLASDDPDVVYVADRGTKAIYYSADGGTERWQPRTSRYSVEDLAVEGDGDVAYVLVLADGKVSKSTNAGFTWGTSKSSKLSGGNMIVSLGEDKVLAGSDDGYVAYSTDGGSSWTKLGKQVGGLAKEVSAIASGLADEDYIYAGLEFADELYRWQLDVDTSWYSINDAVDPVFGIALQDGVLYVSTANVTDSDTLRTLNPTAAVAPSWSTMTSTASFDLEPQGLSVGGGKLWAINSENDKLYSYTDTLVDAVPTLVGPADGYVDKINPISGYAMDVTLSWEKPSAKVTDYQVYIAFDKDFDEVAKKVLVAATGTTVSQVVGHSADAKFDLMPGATYFWKVRVASDGPIYSPWSKVRVISVEKAEVTPAVVVEIPEPAPPAQITVEAPPAPQVTVQAPPAAPAPAPAIPAYMLWVIIAIGAVLVIALIILIVRTRRVV